MTNKADRLEKLMAEMLEIYKAKNADYGDSFADSFKEVGLIAPVVRMNDKMKTKEFIRRVEELGYKVHYAPKSILVYDEYGIAYAKILPYQYAINTIGDGFYNRKKHKELYKLCFEYASTPIEDRGDED